MAYPTKTPARAIRIPDRSWRFAGSLLVLAALVGTLFWLAAYRPAPSAVQPVAAVAAAVRSSPTAAAPVGASPVPAFSRRLAQLAAEPDSVGRSSRLAALVDGCPESSLPDLARAILAVDDPAFATEAAQVFFGSWAAAHTDALLDWLRAQPAADRPAWAGVLADALAAKPALLLAVLNRLVSAEPDQSDTYLSPAAAALATVGQFSTASTLGERIQDTSLRASLRRQLVAAWGVADPSAAGTWLATLSADPERDALFGQLAELWSTSQPHAAAAWAIAQPPSLGRTHALTLAIQAWTTQDAAAAADWLFQQPPEADLDTPIFSLATSSSLAHDQPAIAATWAERIANPDVRFEGIRAIVRGWADTDREAARQFVQQTAGLSEDFRRALLAELGS